MTTYHMGAGDDPTNPGNVRTRFPYHVRVCVPCYKESLEILRRTIMAAYDASLPAGCARTIYLCDDGKASVLLVQRAYQAPAQMSSMFRGYSTGPGYPAPAAACSEIHGLASGLADKN